MPHCPDVNVALVYRQAVPSGILLHAETRVEEGALAPDSSSRYAESG